jgi:hypothetical protein
MLSRPIVLPMEESTDDLYENKLLKPVALLGGGEFKELASIISK